MKGRSLIISVVFGIAAFLFCLAPAAGAGEGVTIKIATLAPDGSSWMKTLNTINAEVMEKTNDQVRFKIYAGGVLGDEKDMLRKMQIGQIHGAGLTSAGLSVLFNEIDVVHLPFFYQNYGEIDYVLKKMGPFFRKGFEDHGYVLLGWSEAGFVYMMSTTPISNIGELKKAKVWIWHESPLAKAIFDEVGVAAIPLSLPDVLVGLQTGLVEVVYAPPTGAIALQWHTRVKYITDVPLSYIGGGIVVKKNIFKKLPESTQKVIIEIFQRHLDQLKTITRKENEEALQVMQKHGVTLVTPPQDQVAEFKRLSDIAMARLIGHAFSQKVVDEATAHLETYRKARKR